jgi:sugar O-acyltransferase (sialic acid O-acetyltransferase NeuD family)
MTKQIVVVGAGGFGREVLDVIDAINSGNATSSPRYLLRGVVDREPSQKNLQRLETRGAPYLGPDESLFRSGLDAAYVIAIGDPILRARIALRYAEAGFHAATLIHPDARIGSMVTIGEGTVICGGVQVSTNVRIGDHVHLNPNSTIGHDTVLESFVSANPAAVVSGEVHVGEGALIGAGAVILQGLSVGAGATVGASACVVRNVPPKRIVKGVPAK